MGAGGILSGITNFIGGGLFKELKETFMAYLPPDLSPEQKAQIELKMQDSLNEKQRAADIALSEAASQLDKRISDQEGTASDLKTIPILGTLVIFLRGCQRPVWGYATLWLDTQWFFGTYTLTDKQNLALVLINVLVLGFLFGERTVLNLQPLIEKVFAKN